MVAKVEYLKEPGAVFRVWLRLVFNIETQPNSSWKQDGNTVSINYEIVYSVYVINKTASIASVPFRNPRPGFSSVFHVFAGATAFSQTRLY